jgi:hypothetical protein
VAQIAAGARFDAIVCDVPNDKSLHDDVSKIDPAQARKMIFLGADAPPDAIADRRRLAKPFTLDQLHDAIATVLAQAPGGDTGA